MISREQVNKSNAGIKEFHLKRLYQLSSNSLGEIPQLEEPTDEQKEWMKKHGF